jgi:hypothetical protein
MDEVVCGVVQVKPSGERMCRYDIKMRLIAITCASCRLWIAQRR